MAALASLLNSFLMMSIGWLVAWRYPLDRFEVFAIWWSIYTTITAFAFDYIRTGVTRYAGGKHLATERAVYVLNVATSGCILAIAAVWALVTPSKLLAANVLVAVTTWALCEVAIAQSKALMDNGGVVRLIFARTLILAVGLVIGMALRAGVTWLFVIVSLSNLLAVFAVPRACKRTFGAIIEACRAFRRADLPLVGRTLFDLSPLAVAAALLNLLMLSMRSLSVWQFDEKATANIALSSDLGFKGVALFFAALMIFPIQRIFSAHDGDRDPKIETLAIGRLLSILSAWGLAATYFLAFVLHGFIFPQQVRATIPPYLLISVVSGVVLSAKLYMADLHLIAQRKVLIIVMSNVILLLSGVAAVAGFAKLIGPVGISLGGLIGITCGFLFSTYKAREHIGYDQTFLLTQVGLLAVYVCGALVLGRFSGGMAGLVVQTVLIAIFLATSLGITWSQRAVKTSVLYALTGR